MVLFVLVFLNLLRLCFSQTDVASFGITTSPQSISETMTTIKLTLSWNTKQYECIINETNILSNTYYGCSLSIEPFATLITNSLSSNTYLMKLEVVDYDNNNNPNNLFRIETIRVMDEDGNYYDIDSFCLPSQFSETDARGTSLELLECCYWSQRYKYNNFAMGNKQNPVLKISYAQFRYNVLNYPNQAHEGAIKPPKITRLGITTLPTSNAGSTSTFSLSLHWDSEQYLWSSLYPTTSNVSYTTSFSSSTSSCNYSSGFSLKISTASTGDSVGIDTIIVKDESGNYYNIDTFCNSDQIRDAQKYSSLGRTCNNEWIAYNEYDGFFYDGTDAIYFIWDNKLFLNINTDQQILALNDSVLSKYDCNKNYAPSSKVTIFEDDMNNAGATGWVFSGTYRSTITATNCPGGPLDSCSRIAGNTSHSTMTHTLDISSFANIIVQYDLRLSSMAYGHSCKLYYAFDGNSFSQGTYESSSGTVPQLYKNQSYSVPDHIDSGYNNLSLRFLNDASLHTEYCWIDNVYIYGDYLIEYDSCSTANTSWTFYPSNRFYTSSYCGSDNRCLYLSSSSYYGIKQYKNINQYNNMVLSIDLQSQYLLDVYYSYNDEPEVLLGTVGRSTTSSSYHSFPNQEFTIPDASICGATVLNIKFKSHYSYSNYVDNIKLWGNVLQTAYPTVMPTFEPTNDLTTESTTESINSEAKKMAVPVLIAIIVIGVIAVIAIGLCAYRLIKTQQKNKRAQDVLGVELADVETEGEDDGTMSNNIKFNPMINKF